MILKLEEIDSYKIIYSRIRALAKTSRILLKTLVGAAGLEPATLCLEGSWLGLCTQTLGFPGLLKLEEIDSYKIIYSRIRALAITSRILLKTLVGAAGLEPATLCLEGRCSIRLSYAPVPGVFSSILAGRGRYFPGTGSQPRVTKSLRLSTSRIPSHSIPPPTTTLVRMVLWRRCMKNSATSIIFTTAINSAMTTLNGPRSMVATTVVAAVRISSDRKTNV